MVRIRRSGDHGCLARAAPADADAVANRAPNGPAARVAARVHILISQSRDGRFIAAVVRRFGINVAVGSSSRGGAVAVRGLLALLKQGCHVGITPDGPRGPRRRAADGVARIRGVVGRADPALRRADLAPMGAEELGPDGDSEAVRASGDRLWRADPRRSRELAQCACGGRSGP